MLNLTVISKRKKVLIFLAIFPPLVFAFVKIVNVPKLLTRDNNVSEKTENSAQSKESAFGNLLAKPKGASTEETRQVVTNDSGNYPEDFPVNIPKYQNARVKNFYKIFNKGTGSRIPEQTYVVLLSTDQKDAILNFYATELEKNGWIISKREEANFKGDTVLNAKIELADKSGEHSVQVTVFKEYEGEKEEGYTYFGVQYMDIF